MTNEDIFMYYYNNQKNIEKIVEQPYAPFHMFNVKGHDYYGGICISRTIFGDELGMIDPNISENVKNKEYEGRPLVLYSYYTPNDDAEQFQRECAEEFKSFPLSLNLKSKYEELFQYLMTLKVE